MKHNIRYLFILLFIILLLEIYLYYRYHTIYYQNNINKNSILYIPTGCNYQKFKKRIKNKLINYHYFILISEVFNYKNNIKPGKYKLKIGESNKLIINKLINGYQDSIRLQIQNFDNIAYIINIIQKNFEAKSKIINYTIKKQSIKDGFSDIDAIKIYFIPGIYNFFWNDSPEKIIKLMKKRYKLFWNTQRKKKTKHLKLTPIQIITFASIIQRESNHTDEQSKIAGLYLNRYKLKMKLQSDPTIIFAKKKKMDLI